jgi:tRNA-specific 2-thiouridylase
MFPLGDIEKPMVREIAEKYKLGVADKKDSQEICFVPHDYKNFVEKKLPEAQIVKGKVKDIQGKVLADHDGIHRFTIGQ